MKVPYSWLRELVPGLPERASDMVQALTDSGTIVEAIHSDGVDDASGAGGDWFRIGRVESFERHPDADKLRLCRVNVGEADGPRQIICGASNFAEGDTVAVVLPGGRMPDGMEIRAAKLRGVESHGMMLSERELGLSTAHDGIMILPSEWAPGDRLGAHLPIGDDVLELEITGNRPDCLGVYGVAREAATALELELAPLHDEDAAASDSAGDVSDFVSVRVEAADLCPRYMARAFTNVRVGASPAWLKARLARSGMRAINNVVDVTNYVMLLTGQPLHAFDQSKLAGGQIVVRRASEGEPVTTLDDVERTLTSDMLVIADGERPAVIAGVMGAADVEVTDSTTTLVLEAATFDGMSIQHTSRELGLRSESSSRFEKGLDVTAPEAALRIASRLLVELCGASMASGTIDERAAGDNGRLTIEMDSALPSRVLGIDVSDDDVTDTLTRLGFVVERRDAVWSIAAPPWRRADVTRPIDVVEEIGRFRVADIPALLPPIAVGGALLTSRQRLRRHAEDTLAGMGLTEIVTYGLVAPGTGVGLGVNEADVVRLSNPGTVDHSELRTGLLASHLEVVQRNHSAGSRDVAMFEIGRTFLTAPAGERGADGLPVFARERDVVGLVMTGTIVGERWDAPGIPVDFSTAAGAALGALGALGVDARPEAMSNPPAWLHPGQCAELRAAADDSLLGWVAAVHPRYAQERGVSGDVYAAHLDLDAVHAARVAVPRFRAFSEFPPVVEDIAVILDQSVEAGDVLHTAREAGGELLELVTVFDRYVGAPIADDKYSLALRLTFRAPDRTLTDAETADVRTRIVDALAARHGATLRSA